MLSELTERELWAAAFANLLFLHPWKQEINAVFMFLYEKMTWHTQRGLRLFDSVMNFLFGNQTREGTSLSIHCFCVLCSVMCEV